MNRRSALAVAVLAFGGMLGAAPAAARRRRPARAHRTQSRGAEPVAISSDAAARIARDATGGRILSVKLTGNGAPYYRVRVLLGSGRVRTLAVDARSGALRR